VASNAALATADGSFSRSIRVVGHQPRSAPDAFASRPVASFPSSEISITAAKSTFSSETTSWSRIRTIDSRSPARARSVESDVIRSLVGGGCFPTGSGSGSSGAEGVDVSACPRRLAARSIKKATAKIAAATPSSR
jgi:hypothetical protein